MTQSLENAKEQRLNMNKFKIEDVTEKEWKELDYTLEKYDRIGSIYPENEIPLLKFVYTLIGEDIENFEKVPNFIRMSKAFMSGAIKYNGRVYQYMR